MAGFTTSWNKSTQPRKQRKFRHASPLHIKQKFIHVHLSPSLRTKYGTRSIQVRKGDKVKVLRGSFKGKEGSVDKVSLKNSVIFVSGIELTKRDNTKQQLPIKPSNVMITVLDTKGGKRKLKAVAKEQKKGESKE